jgi:hypothetical protein
MGRFQFELPQPSQHTILFLLQRGRLVPTSSSLNKQETLCRIRSFVGLRPTDISQAMTKLMLRLMSIVMRICVYKVRRWSAHVIEDQVSHLPTLHRRTCGTGVSSSKHALRNHCASYVVAAPFAVGFSRERGRRRWKGSAFIGMTPRPFSPARSYKPHMPGFRAARPGIFQRLWSLSES